MTMSDVKSSLLHIKGRSDDNEIAHALEDELYENFIAFVAMRGDDLGAMAREVLKTKEIEFARRCAE